MSKIKLNFHLWNKHIFLGSSFVVFAIITSIYWGFVSATTTGEILKPTLTAPTITSSSVTLVWTNPTDNNPAFNTYIKIQRRLHPTTAGGTPGAWSVVKSITSSLSVNNTYLDERDIIPNSIYDYQIEFCSGVSPCPSALLENVKIPAVTTTDPNEIVSCSDLALKLNDGKTSYIIGDVINYTWSCTSLDDNTSVFMMLKRPDASSPYLGYGAGHGNTLTGRLETNTLTAGGPYTLYACLSQSCESGSITSSQSFNLTSPIIETITAPKPPTNFTHETLTSASTSIILKWVNDLTTLDKIKLTRIYRETAGLNNLSLLKTITVPGTNSFEDTNNITSDTIYNYYIEVCNTDTTCSTPKTPLLGVVIPPKEVVVDTITAPKAPTGFIHGPLTSASTSIILRWVNDLTTLDKIKLTKIYRETSGLNNIGLIKTIEGATINSFEDKVNIDTETKYNYYIEVCATAELCSTPRTLLPDVIIPKATVIIETPTAPKAPTSFIHGPLTSDSTSITLKWINNTTTINSQKLIRIKRKTNGLNDIRVIATITTLGANSFEDINVNAGIKYDYYLEACNTSILCSTPIVSLLGVIIPKVATEEVLTSPSAPAEFNNDYLSAGSTSITLRWKYQTNDKIKFQIKRKLSSELSYPSTARYTYPNVYYYIDKDITIKPGAHYDYALRACYSETLCSENPIIIKGVSIPIKEEVIVPKEIIEPIITKPIETNPVELITKTEPVSLNTSEKIFIANTIEAPIKIENLGLAIEEIKITVDITKKFLINIVNENTLAVIKDIETSGRNIDVNKIYTYRDELINKIQLSLSNITNITKEDIEKIKSEVSLGIDNIKKLGGESSVSIQADRSDFTSISGALNELSGAVNKQTNIFQSQGADLVYKDSNKDGISDYDSVHVYNLDPIRISPISIFEGKSINASEKILLGFDPSKKELVKVKTEEPLESKAKIVSTYKVKNVEYDEKNKVVLKGQALPNSFITIYIYSTPIMVTIKTDSTGEWKYVLDKELENGSHTVYTASVNNTGNIIAKSSPYSFVKTAEAVTLNELPIAEASNFVEKPSLLSTKNIFMSTIGFFMALGIILILIGVLTKKNTNIEGNV